MNRAEILNKLKKNLSEKRYKHCLGVAETAEKLALKQNIAKKKAYIAGLLHDCAKDITIKKIKKYCQQSTWTIDEDEWSMKKLLHAPASAYLAQEEYGIYDKDILSAIRYHTIGATDMSNLSKIIFIADFIEPNRNFNDVIELRKDIEKNIDIDYVLIKICDNIIRYNVSKRRLIHPNTIQLRNSCLRRKT
ncbi:MAG: bis(5'-nucleosyl)-tetraphosphatase (symmetrical) YqeK [Halothermotrichaceae bacterium]